MTQLKSQRRHIPALTSEQLAEALRRLAIARLSPRAKRNIAAMLVQAAGGGETVDTALAAIAPERRQHVQDMEAELATFHGGIVGRGREALLTMDDAEWARLVESAGRE